MRMAAGCFGLPKCRLKRGNQWPRQRRRQVRKPGARPKIKRKNPRRGRRTSEITSATREADFDLGLRTYAKYRDLGIAGDRGMVQAHVIRFIPPFRPEEVSIPHYHDVDFQMVYVLKGCFQSEFEGQVVNTFHAG
jgi:hypothetical protein